MKFIIPKDLFLGENSMGISERRFKHFQMLIHRQKELQALFSYFACPSFSASIDPPVKVWPEHH